MVWVDWLCMWQGDKEGQREITVDEKYEFDQMLGEVNMLYLGCQVAAALGPLVLVALLNHVRGVAFALVAD